jgi:hypothetical protein
MKFRILNLSALVIAGTAASAFGVVPKTQFEVISQRNPFALRPIPPVVEAPAPEVPKPPRPEIRLTGISTLLGQPKVFLQVADPQTKKTEFPLGMIVGERFGEIEILSVDPENGVVRIRDGESETSLDFEHNGVKPSEAARPPQMASAQPVPMPPSPAGHPDGPKNVIYAGGGQPVGAPTSPVVPAINPSPFSGLSREEIMAKIAEQRKTLLERQAQAK